MEVPKMSDNASRLSRIVGVEEHVVFPELTSRLPEEAVINRGYLSRDKPYGGGALLDKAADELERAITQHDFKGAPLRISAQNKISHFRRISGLVPAAASGQGVPRRALRHNTIPSPRVDSSPR
jgi:hypothetical protein